MKILKTVVLATFLLTVGAPMSAGWGQDYQKGIAAVERGDYGAALREWHPLAEQGDAKAQLGLGRIYIGGNGVARNFTEAAKWFRKAALQGEAFAQVGLAMIYMQGAGVTQDNTEAAKWFRKAALQGVPFAQHLLAIHYAEGNGVEQDDVRAYMWFTISASLGNKQASEWRDTAAAKMTPDRIAEAQKLAREWVLKFEAQKKK